MVPVVKLQHYTQSWSFLLRETAFFGLILLPALEFTCVTTSASRWVFRLCVVCISMRAERCSLFSFHSPCPEKWLKLTSHFIYALFHPASPLLARIYEAGKQEAGCSGFLFPPFPSLFAFLPCRMMPLPCVPKPSGFVELWTWPQRRSPGSAASSRSWKRKLAVLTRVSCAKPPGSDLYSLLFPFLWFHSISLVLPPSAGLSALLHPTELHPLRRPHLLTSFPQPGSPSDKGGALSSGQ